LKYTIYHWQTYLLYWVIKQKLFSLSSSIPEPINHPISISFLHIFPKISYPVLYSLLMQDESWLPYKSENLWCLHFCAWFFQQISCLVVSFIFLQMTEFQHFYDWIKFNWVYIPYFLYSSIKLVLRLFSYLTCCVYSEICIAVQMCLDIQLLFAPNLQLIVTCCIMW
jgi:hypothetical protein